MSATSPPLLLLIEGNEVINNLLLINKGLNQKSATVVALRILVI